MKEGALQGLKVADFTWVYAGPAITKYLADHGATVIRVESAERPDLLRISGPFKDNKPGIDRSGYFASFNSNKYSISLNLKHPKGLDLAKQLVAWADVVAENFTAGTMSELGLGYEELKKVRSDIIMISCGNQGATGPHSNHPGVGIQLTALAGITNLTGWPDRMPVQPLGPYTNIVAPRFGASALLAALDYRQKTGKGQYIDVSQLEATLHFISPLLLDFCVNGRENMRQGNSASFAAPHGVYPCRGDDRWCAIAILTDDEWTSFCKIIGNPPWTKTWKFATFLNRKANEAELDCLIGQWTQKLSAEEVMTILQAEGIAAGVVKNVKDICEDPQIAYRQYFWAFNHREMGSIFSTGEAFLLSDTPSQPYMPPPCLGEHTEYVCTQILGLSDEEFVELLYSGAIE
jgi:benzylsuccinate CoA-transferase BbsF subunit